MRYALLFLLLTISSQIFADEAANRVEFEKPAATSADEPLAKSLSLEKAGKYLDGVGVNWTRDRKCITCHTNMPHLVARPLLPGDEGWKETRTFFETTVQSWSKGKKPKNDTSVVAIAFALAFNDQQKTNGQQKPNDPPKPSKLHESTRAALDKMWTVQKTSGEWNWLKCDWPPFEHDDYYGATLAALAVGYAPDSYAETEKAKQGIERLTAYLQKTPAPDVHHATMLLWAASKLDGLITDEENTKTIATLRKIQHDDGGWGLASLGKYSRKDGTENDSNCPSDGYATGFVTFVLLQSGVKPDDAAIVKSVKWIKSNQRESGRWFTRSLNNDKAHYITNGGTAFCVLALDAAGEK